MLAQRQTENSTSCLFVRFLKGFGKGVGIKDLVGVVAKEWKLRTEAGNHHNPVSEC